jgi:hypothetical protein
MLQVEASELIAPTTFGNDDADMVWRSNIRAMYFWISQITLALNCPFKNVMFKPFFTWILRSFVLVRA